MKGEKGLEVAQRTCERNESTTTVHDSGGLVNNLKKESLFRLLICAGAGCPPNSYYKNMHRRTPFVFLLAVR